MRAIVAPKWGDPDVLAETEVPTPEPGPTEIRVRVRAAGVNPVDFYTRAGGGMAGVLGDPPVILGWDVAGVVDQVGFGTTGFRVGDEVHGMPLFPKQAGGYAEYVVAPSRQFAPKPAGLSMAEAAAIPLAGLTAWQALVDVADIQPGERILITAAAGGVGHLAVQIAKARGGYVVGTARAAKHDYLRSIGVDEPIDYTAVAAADTAREIDVVLDCFGANTADLLATLRPDGLLVAVPSGVSPELAAAGAARGVRTAPILVEPDQLGLFALADLVATGQLRVRVDAVLPLADAAKAHELGARRQTTGKIVLSVD
jgi:NADPH:quinone reductase-like Zn-dependent oxidoreductase